MGTAAISEPEDSDATNQTDDDYEMPLPEPGKNKMNKKKRKADDEKADEKAKKKKDDGLRVEAKKRQLEEIIKERRESKNLLTSQELMKKIRELESENRILKTDNNVLREQLSHNRSSNLGLSVTPRKLTFRKQLTHALGDTSVESNRDTTPAERSTPAQRGLSFAEENDSYHWVANDTDTNVESNCDKPAQSSMPTDGSQRAQRSLSFAEENDSYHWEESVTKVRLVNDMDVFITQGQLSHSLHTGSTDRRLTICLLDILFTKQQLAKSSAKGSRKAHNAKFDTKALPELAVNAIKRFVLKKAMESLASPTQLSME